MLFGGIKIPPVAGATFVDVNFSCTVSNCGSLVCLLIRLVCFVLAKVASMSIWREIQLDKKHLPRATLVV